MDCCDEIYKTSGLNNAQQNPKLKGASSAECESCVHRNFGLNSRLGCFRPSRRSIWLLCRFGFPLERAGEALDGKATVKVSAVWLRNPSSNYVSPCFLHHFITKDCGAGDRLHRPAGLLLFGWHFSWNVPSFRYRLYCIYLTMYYHLQSLLVFFVYLLVSMMHLFPFGILYMNLAENQAFIKIKLSTFYLTTRGPSICIAAGLVIRKFPVLLLLF